MATEARYSVVPARRWQHDDGSTASLHGAIPWTNEENKTHWRIVDCGWTVRDSLTGRVGIGRPPWSTPEDAEAWANAHNGPGDDAITCPECREPVWDTARGHKLNKCWNAEGHADGGTLAFDGPFDDD